MADFFTVFTRIVFVPFNYAVQIILAIFLFAKFVPHKEHALSKFVLSGLLLTAFIVAIDSATYYFIPQKYEFPCYIVEYVGTFVLMVVFTVYCVKCSWAESLSYCLAAYCMQHIANRVFCLFYEFFLNDKSKILLTVLSLVVTVIVYAAFYFGFIRKRFKHGRPTRVSNAQLLIAGVVVGITIFYNAEALSYARDVSLMYQKYSLSPDLGKKMLLFVYIVTILIAFLAFLLSMLTNYGKQYKEENYLLDCLLKENGRQYEENKVNIELLNMQLHDLKHYIGSLDSENFQLQKDGLIESISSIDASVHTGNDVLDTLFTQKNVQCREKGIRINCMLKGVSFGKITDYELYMLFCNTVDNAIEAVKALPEEKRVISVTAQRNEEGKTVFLSENYYAGKILLKGNLPQNKDGDPLHGYGMKSIKTIVCRYGGEVWSEVNDDIFSLYFTL